MQSQFFPFGFVYPSGLSHSDSNPDPAIESIRHRMAYLNRVHSATILRGEDFSAAMAKFQQESKYEPDAFWPLVEATFSDAEVAQIAEVIFATLPKQPDRLAFPNAVALFDCRFVSTSEWEHVRKYSLGGSDAAAVLGLSHFKSPRGVFLDKTSTDKEDRSLGSQHILDYGHAVESFVIDQTAETLGCKHYPEYRMFAHRKYPFITCNPDGILQFPDGHFTLFEAKTAFWMKRADWKDAIPEYYAPQPRQYQEVLDDPKSDIGYISVCFGGALKDNLGHKYKRDREAGQAQIQQLVQFWNAYIVPGVLPPLSGDPDLDMPTVYRQGQFQPSNGKAGLPDTAIPLFGEYTELKEEKTANDKHLKALSALETDLLNQIRDSIPEGYTVARYPGTTPYYLQAKDSVRRSVDRAALNAVDPQVVRELMGIAERNKDVSLGWSTPVISVK